MAGSSWGMSSANDLVLRVVAKRHSGKPHSGKPVEDRVERDVGTTVRNRSSASGVQRISSLSRQLNDAGLTVVFDEVQLGRASSGRRGAPGPQPKGSECETQRPSRTTHLSLRYDRAESRGPAVPPVRDGKALRSGREKAARRAGTGASGKWGWTREGLRLVAARLSARWLPVRARPSPSWGTSDLPIRRSTHTGFRVRSSRPRSM
jgi:hypothetical protein